MRPVLQKRSINKKMWIVYIGILILCMVGIAIALYMQHYREEKVGLALGITNKDSEEEDEYNELKAEFDKIFTNNLDILQEENPNVKKINDNYDFVITAYNYEKSEENVTINVSVPSINIESTVVRQLNSFLNQQYKENAERLINQYSGTNIVYSVDYKAYIQNNVLSIAIRSEYKEGSKDQKLMIQTFNYNLLEDRKMTVEDMLKLKNITSAEATEKIRNEIKQVQERNKQLIEEGYAFYQRDHTSDIYNVLNSKQQLYGKDGMLYIIYPYGNEEDTTEMDIVIFR